MKQSPAGPRIPIARVSCIHGTGVFSDVELCAGDLILEIAGTLAESRTASSFQVAPGLHLESQSAARYINHSCDPTCFLRLKDAETLLLIARTNLSAKAELTLDYATFEYERSSGPIVCLCGSAACRGSLTGYRGLTADQREPLSPYLLPYLASDAVRP